jgi:hypothetical protein
MGIVTGVGEEDRLVHGQVTMINASLQNLSLSCMQGIRMTRASCYVVTLTLTSRRIRMLGCNDSCCAARLIQNSVPLNLPTAPVRGDGLNELGMNHFGTRIAPIG